MRSKTHLCPSMDTDLRRGVWLHRFAVLTACVTLPLIFIGGLVTSHDAALAVPDWPTSYGYNMFLFPWEKWVGGIRYEHPHRLFGSLLGFLAIALTVWVMIRERKRRWLRVLTLLSLALIILQGVLGGYRVILLLKPLAIFHACLAQVIFCLLSAIALFTSRWWRQQEEVVRSPDTGSLRKWTLLCAILIFCQLILGAVMRHTDSGLAVPDFPRMYGRWVPPLDQAALKQINDVRPWDDPLTLWQIGIHVAHRIGAVIVCLGITAMLAGAWRHYRTSKAIFRPALILAGLVILQLGLGISVIWTQKAADIATAHVAMGALILVTGFLLTLIAFKTQINKR